MGARSAPDLEPITGHREQSPGYAGINMVNFGKELGSKDGLTATQGVEEEKERGTEAICRFNNLCFEQAASWVR